MLNYVVRNYEGDNRNDQTSIIAHRESHNKLQQRCTCHVSSLLTLLWSVCCEIKTPWMCEDHLESLPWLLLSGSTQSAHIQVIWQWEKKHPICTHKDDSFASKVDDYISPQSLTSGGFSCWPCSLNTVHILRQQSTEECCKLEETSKSLTAGKSRLLSHKTRVLSVSTHVQFEPA